MSENIPESIPTSLSSRSHRPIKKSRPNNNDPSHQQSAQLEALFANPDRAAAIPVGPKTKAPLLPPEIVANVQGSSAGAGSGEFHVYKASRRREYERLRVMDEETKEGEAEREFQERKAERERKDEEILAKNRAKREKAKKRQERKKLGLGAEKLDRDTNSGKKEGTGSEGAGVAKKKLAPAKVSLSVMHEGNVTDESGGGQAAQEEAGITIHDDD